MKTRVRTSGTALTRPVQVKGRVLPSDFDLELMYEDGSPDLVLGCETRDGVPQCRRVELRSTPEGREIQSSDLRGVKLEDLLEIAVVSAATHPEKQGQQGEVVIRMRPARTEEERRETLTQMRATRRDARRRVSDELLQEIAQVYRDHLDGTPTAAVAQHTGRAHRTAALYVKQAREAGFLGAAVRGKAGEQR